MKISTKGRYGIRAGVELAGHFGEKAVKISEIARAQKIPVKYLAQIINSLRKFGIVKSVRGAKGGYSLARPPAAIRVGELLRVLEGPLSPVECVDKPEACERVSTCATRVIWCQLSDSINETLNKITLADLARMEKEGKVSDGKMYYI